jgi:hypothetical protein
VVGDDDALSGCLEEDMRSFTGTFSPTIKSQLVHYIKKNYNKFLKIV